jgi:polysaccharide deacetylase family protein (PEP-CTERM system associated)
MAPPGQSKHLLTVSVEDYFHSGSLQGVVAPKHWTRIESRLEKSIRETLDLLGEHQIAATFFVLGWIAERQPEIIRMIRSAGHEIASRGYGKGEVRSPQALRENLQRTREALERAGSNRIFGYRHWRWLNRPEELWVLDVLAAEGYAYDSSVSPLFRRFRKEASAFFEAHPRPRPAPGEPMWEFPVSTTSFMGFRIPISGGNYLRQLPHRIMSQAIAEWHRSRPSPILFYFFPWEIDCEQPQIQGLSTFQRMRHYRRIGKTRHVMRKYARLYQFQPIGDFLGLPWRTAPVTAAPARPVAEILTTAPELPPDAMSVSVVVPLYNEETNVPYLRGNLIDLAVRLRRQFHVQFVLVDDGSSDGTWKQLNERFADLPGCRLIRHEKNQGVAAAIMTGIREAKTPIVASMDCDCSYDPAELEKMIPMIKEADLVTASPYHPDGEVYNVPPWRLFLSRTLSSIYSVLLSSKIHTYTSCFRVYRKEAVEKISIRQGGFLGVAEMLIRLKLAGGRVAEYPTTLASRLFGESKMKVIRTIVKHLGLVGELTRLRLRGEPVSAAVPPSPLPVPAAPPPATTPAASASPTTTPVETP